jgi:branched-chain amino acid transport system ATP-binding protein
VTDQSEPVLAATGLVKRYGQLTVLGGVDFEVGAAEAVGIVGPNGAGKTTLLSILAGSVEPNEGRIRLNQQDVSRLRSDVRCRQGIARAFQVPRPGPVCGAALRTAGAATSW